MYQQHTDNSKSFIGGKESHSSHLLGGGGDGGGARLALLAEEEGVDVGDGATLSDRGHGHQLVKLLVVAHGQLDVLGLDGLLLVLLAGVAGKLENLNGDVLEHGSSVDTGADTDAVAVLALSDHAVATTDGEDKVCAGGGALLLLLGVGGLAGFSGHGEDGGFFLVVQI